MTAFFLIVCAMIFTGCEKNEDVHTLTYGRKGSSAPVTTGKAPDDEVVTWNRYALGASLSDSSFYADACGLIDVICAGEESFSASSETAAEALAENMFFNFPPAALCSFTVNGKDIEIEWSVEKKTERIKAVEDFGNKVSSVISSLQLDKRSEPEIALLLYRWTAKNVKYFETDYNDKQISAYNALMDGYTICYGFADTYNYLLRQTGIKAELLRGSRIGDNAEHGWSLVTINGKLYHCDPTWERSTTGGNGLVFFGMTDRQRYEYLNKNPVRDFGILETIYDNRSASSTTFLDIQKLTNWNIDKIANYIDQ